MKLKGVNPIEQHIEKIVLMVMLVLLLAVLAMQFVSRPNDIDVGDRSVSPDQVYTVLEGEASRLDGQLKNQNPSLPEINEVDLVQRYNDAFANASGGRVELTAALGSGIDITDIGVVVHDGDRGSKGPVNALAVPVTSQPVAASQWSTLDPYAIELVPEYQKYVPSVQPFDFPSVSVEATFSGTDLKSVLLGSGNVDNAIPKRFWSTGIAILGFDAERQKLLPDGSWGASEPVVRPPHTPMPTVAIHKEAGLFELTDLVKKAEGVASEIVRPMFPPTIAGTPWTPPSERGASADDSEAVAIARAERLLKRSEEELVKLNEANKRNASRIARTEKRIQELKDQLKDLGVNPEDTGTSRTRTTAADQISVLDKESVALWIHDLGVDAGATYRYRTRVVVNNPLFRKGGELDPDDAAQQAMTLNAFSRGEWSSWSHSVVVGAEEYFFVTKAETGSRISGSEPKATLEMYKMYYGHYRRSTFSAAPGDELATTVRMSGSLLMFDTATIKADDAAKAIEAMAGDEPSTKLPVGITELSNRITIDLGAFVLDVYEGQSEVENELGQTTVPMQVILRDTDGRVIVRTDLSDKGSPAYALATQSASDASGSMLRAPGEPAKSPAAELFKKPAP